MQRFQTSGPPKASLNAAALSRRGVLMAAVAVAAGGSAGCERPMPLTASKTPRLNMDPLTAAAQRIAERIAPGVLGAGLLNLESGEIWSMNGERPFPMQSVFKAPLAAGVLAEVDAGRLNLDEQFILDGKDLSPPWSPIAAAWPGRRQYSARDLLEAAVGVSDNTAADLLLRRIGGPGALTAWLQAKKITEIRIDRYERELQPDTCGMASFRADWRGETYDRICAGLPSETRRAALLKALSDPRDTATPRGALDFLERLDGGEMISPASKQLLLGLMTHAVKAQGRLKAAVPAGAALAHKPGTGRTDLGVNLATNDVGLLTLQDGRRYALSAFLSGSTLDASARDLAITDLAHAMVRAIG